MLMDGLIEIKDNEFQMISRLIYKMFGIHLTEKKNSLVWGRLHTLLKNEGHSSFKDYYKAVISDKTNSSLLTLVDKISTNHTYFFREEEHFKILKKNVLPEICSNRKVNEIRIWCAGCATGEEAYSLAFLLNEYFLLNNKMKYRILGTDISISALETAMPGIYSKEKIASIPETFKKRHLKKNDANMYTIKNDIKDLITFKRLNLIQDDFPFKRKFHIIFCRNVMIYFDKATRENLIKAFNKNLFGNGYLFVGHSETLNRENEYFKPVYPAVYKKRWENL